ncbi:hypothetical protein CFOL_v3_01138, partial [Cephalotus follicularis]
KQAEKASNKKILDIFRKIEVNIPLLDAIQQIPKYAKFLKELCTNKRRLKGNERVSLSQNVSALIQPMPQKCQDPGTFSIPCTSGHSVFHDCMLDLGASINVMPESMYQSLSLGPLHTTGIIIQLANRSSVCPSGLVEDVLVRVGNLIFPADFYIMGMEGGSQCDTIIPGRPFLKTARTKIDVHSGTLSMEFGDSIVRFNIIDAMKHPREEHSVFCLDVINEVVDAVSIDFMTEYHKLSSFLDFDACGCTEIDECAICAEFSSLVFPDFTSALIDQPDCIDYYDSSCDSGLPVETIDDHNSVSEQLTAGKVSELFSADIVPTKLLPSIEQPPKLELKPLPDHLKYAFLEENDQLPVIVAKHLSPAQEDKLLALLKENKRAIGWTMTDIIGISPSTCLHRILLEEGAKPVRQPQRRLNPLILDVVKKEVTKLLQAGIIYPISDSQWVSPVHVVPKKSGVTVIAFSILLFKDGYPWNPNLGLIVFDYSSFLSIFLILF